MIYFDINAMYKHPYFLLQKMRFTEFGIMKLKVKITMLYGYLKWYAFEYMQCTIGYIFNLSFIIYCFSKTSSLQIEK